MLEIRERMMRIGVLLAAVGIFALSACTTDRQTLDHIAHNPVPGACESSPPADQDAIGCYLNAVQKIASKSADPLYWHIYAFADGRSAEAARLRGRSSIVRAFGRVWLYTLTDQPWAPRGGERMAVIGPLHIRPGVSNTVRYMQATFPPGMKTPVHVHSGPEAWYVVTGAQCLRTPDETIVARAGQGAVVREGPPMILSTVGGETRRAVLMVIHDSRRPWNTDYSHWQPQETCPAS
jgi:quercetin dioxygenase-like cupin family protein